MPKHLLLADDSKTIQQAVSMTFADEDVSITNAPDGGGRHVAADGPAAAARRGSAAAWNVDASQAGSSSARSQAALVRPAWSETAGATCRRRPASDVRPAARPARGPSGKTAPLA